MVVYACSPSTWEEVGQEDHTSDSSLSLLRVCQRRMQRRLRGKGRRKGGALAIRSILQPLLEVPEAPAGERIRWFRKREL